MASFIIYNDIEDIFVDHVSCKSFIKFKFSRMKGCGNLCCTLHFQIGHCHFGHGEAQ